MGDIPAISFIGQAKGALVMALLGFVPALVIGVILRMFGLLRVRNEVEIMGLDVAEIPSQGYPEFARWEEAADDGMGGGPRHSARHDARHDGRPDAPVMRDRVDNRPPSRDPDRMPPPPRRTS